MRRRFTIFLLIIFAFSVAPVSLAQNNNVKEIKRIIQKRKSGIKLTSKEQEIFDNLDPSIYATQSSHKTNKPVLRFFNSPKGTKAEIDESFEDWFDVRNSWTLEPSDPNEGDGAWVQDDGSTYGPGSVFDGSYAAMFNNYDYDDGVEGSMTTPEFDVSSYTNPQVSFYWWNGDNDADNPALLIISTSTDGNTFTPIDTIETYGTTDWVEYTRSINTSVTYVKITGVSDYGYKNTFIDKFEIDEGPTNPVFSISPDSKNFGTIFLGETSQPQTFTITNTGGGTLNITSLSLAGDNPSDFNLTDNNTYPVSLGPNATMSVSVTFSPKAEGARTAVLHIESNAKVIHEAGLSGTGHDATITPPFTEDFATYLPTDWREGQGLLANPSTITGTSSMWTQENYRNDASDSHGKAAKINIWGTTKKDWLFTPPIDLGDGSTHYQLEFDLALTDYGNSGDPDPAPGADDKFAVIISTDRGATWSSANALQIWDNTTSPSFSDIPSSGQHVVISLAAYSGVVKIGFYGESTVTNGDNDLFVDNVEVSEIPTSPVFSVNPSSKDFGTVFLHESSSEQTFTVTNAGQGTLQITATTITGANSSDFILTDNNTYPVNLANNQTMTVQVHFTPSAAGSRSATLRFTANAKTEHDVSLSGTGYDATVTTFPYNEPFTSFTVADDATGYTHDWSTSPSATTTSFRWNTNKGSTPSFDTGPSVDHTSGDANGIYLYTEATWGNPNDSAFVYTPPFNLSSLTNPAVKFYYHMYGENMGKLQLQVSDDYGSTWTTLVTITGQQQTSSNEAWKVCYTELSAYVGKTVKLRFKATRGNGSYGDMAIDDFYIGERINKSLSSLTVEQASTSNVLIGSSNNEILKLTFDVKAGYGSLPLNSITVTSANDNDADIANNGVKLYRTSSPMFATDNLVATGSFAKGAVTFSGLNYDLPAGYTYFWIAYDIASTATVGNKVDAKILANGIDVNGNTYNSSDDDPAGERTLYGIIFNSVSVTQASTSDVEPGTSNAEILRIAFDVTESTESGAPKVDFTSLTVTGANSDDNDVSAVKIYKTSGSAFSADNLVATGTLGKGGITFNLSENVTSDIYYWVAYDISTSATDGNTVDALIPANGMTIDGNAYNSSDDNPAGSRTIRSYSHGGNGTSYGGYYFANSTPSGGENRPSFSWINPISEGHTQITSWTYGGADDGYYQASIGFNFTFFGSSYSDCYIGTNGLITFGGGYSNTGASASIPSSDNPNNMIAVALMDLDDMSDGKVYYGTTGGNFVVTWYHYHDYSDDNEWITCQAILKPNGNIKLQYNYSESQVGADILGDALIGIENAGGTDGHEYRNNGNGGPMFDNSSKVGSLALEYSKDESALPVELSSFTAIPNDEGVVEIKWTTQTEINTAQFEVERTEITDNDNAEAQWRAIGSVQASGNSNSPKEYSFKDELEHSGKYKYRLKIVDVDGSYKYGNEVEIYADIALKYELSQNYPNPFNPTTTIKFSIKKEGNVRLEVFNVLGQRVAALLNKKMKAGKYKVKFNARNYASGVYFYRIESGNFSAVKKMMLLK